MSRLRNFLFVVGCIAALSFLSVPAQARTNAGRVQEIITEMGKKASEDPSLPGLSIAVLRKGEDTPVCAAFGVARIESDAPMTVATRFKIGSVTKLFTAAIIHGLIEDGKLAYGTTIDRFFPHFPSGNTITVRNLLEHTSGIADMLTLKPVYSNLTRYWSTDELIAMVAEEPLLFQPGTAQKYSNTGYLMLAVISEQVSGESYGPLLQRLLAEKLGMRSLLVADDDSAIIPGIACGYTLTQNGDLALPLPASLAIAKGTGNIMDTPGDVVRLVNLDRVLKNDILSTIPLTPLTLQNGQPSTFIDKDSHFTGSDLDGCTLFLFSEPKMDLVGKLGSFPGFGTAYFYDRQTGFALVVSVNNEKSMPKAVALGASVLHALRQ